MIAPCGEIEEQIRELIIDYVRAFETLDADRVVGFYGPTCVFISPESVTAVTDRESALRVASFLIEHAKAAGYKRTEAERLDVRVRGDRLAEVTGTFVRYDPADNEIGRFGVAYTLHRTDGWKIVVAMFFSS